MLEQEARLLPAGASDAIAETFVVGTRPPLRSGPAPAAAARADHARLALLLLLEEDDANLLGAAGRDAPASADAITHGERSSLCIRLGSVPDR